MEKCLVTTCFQNRNNRLHQYRQVVYHQIFFVALHLLVVLLVLLAVFLVVITMSFHGQTSQNSA